MRTPDNVSQLHGHTLTLFNIAHVVSSDIANILIMIRRRHHDIISKSDENPCRQILDAHYHSNTNTHDMSMHHHSPAANAIRPSRAPAVKWKLYLL